MFRQKHWDCLSLPPPSEYFITYKSIFIMKLVSYFVNPRGSDLEKIYISAGTYEIRDDQRESATEFPLRH
jgi:hypothetical protein